jgi:signal transduction histidine kinase
MKTAVDILDRRNLAAARRVATTRERKRIARELHDGLGQELLGLSLLASGLAAEHARDHSKLARDLKLLSELASRSVATCRLLAHDLTPLHNRHANLAETLKRLAVESRGYSIAPTVLFTEATSAPSLISREASNHLYRIAQEALNNALKHSEANIVQIELCIDQKKISLRIRDDGFGLERLMTYSQGMGLQTMRDRAAAIGGRLIISANGPSGTLIDCECCNRAARLISP